MPSGPATNDPLLRAIAELRADVKYLIDEQIAYVRKRVEEPIPPRATRSSPVLSVSAPPAEETRERSLPLDPKQRLDALARHLNHRLRRANGPAPEGTERSPTPEG